MGTRSGTWSADEDAVVRERYATNSSKEIAALLNRSVASVRNRCWTLELAAKHKPWSDDELRLLHAYYTSDTKLPVKLSELAALLQRDKANISRKARELGLTNQRRHKKPPAPPPPVLTSEELHLLRSARQKEAIATHGHPRGALGMRHTDETRAKMAASSRARWQDPNSACNTPEFRQKLSDNMLQRIREGRGLTKPDSNPYSRAHHGRRSDLDNAYFRSRWEANYARYLNFLLQQEKVAGWYYEIKTFYFESITRGTRTYTPDFLVVMLDNTYEWHEVKGWMDPQSKVRLRRMAQFYPNETVRIIDAAWFRTANRSIAYVIPHWERESGRGKLPA